jgi:hypothetical protein
VSNDTVVKLIQPGILTDWLTEVLRDGARALLTQAVEAEVSEFLAATVSCPTPNADQQMTTAQLSYQQSALAIWPSLGFRAFRKRRFDSRERLGCD